MNFYDVAIKMENDGEKFYLDMASKTKNDGLKNILTMLAGDEAKHFKIFEKMKKNEEISDSFPSALKKSSEIFKKENKDDFIKSINQINLYKKALNIERKSINFYTSEMNKAENEQQKENLTGIIKEENKHFELIEYIIDLVSRPERWVEHAEFTLREDY
jgi:rubrerythrin